MGKRLDGYGGSGAYSDMRDVDGRVMSKDEYDLRRWNSMMEIASNAGYLRTLACAVICEAYRDLAARFPEIYQVDESETDPEKRKYAAARNRNSQSRYTEILNDKINAIRWVMNPGSIDDAGSLVWWAEQADVNLNVIIKKLLEGVEAIREKLRGKR